MRDRRRPCFSYLASKQTLTKQVNSADPAAISCWPQPMVVVLEPPLDPSVVQAQGSAAEALAAGAAGAATDWLLAAGAAAAAGEG